MFATNWFAFIYNYDNVIDIDDVHNNDMEMITTKPLLWLRYANHDCESIRLSLSYAIRNYDDELVYRI